MTYEEMINQGIMCDNIKYVKPFNLEKSLAFVQDFLADEEKNKLLHKLDWDVDGIFSTSIGYKFFEGWGKQSYVYSGTSKVHGLDSDFVNYVLRGGFTHVIIYDCGTNDMEEISALCSNGIKLLIIDHHLANYQYDDYPSKCIIINSKMENNDTIKEISAGMLTYLVVAGWRAYFKRPKRMQDLVLGYCTLISDSCKLDDDYIKPIILAAGEYTPYIPVEIKAFMTKWDKQLSRTFLTYSVNNKINAVCRCNRYDVLLEFFFETLSEERREALMVTINDIYKEAKNWLQTILEHNTSICSLTSSENAVIVELDKLVCPEISKEFLENSTGNIGSKMSELYGVPAITLISQTRDLYKGSYRDTKSEIRFEDVLKILDIEGGGHGYAMGFRLPKIELNELIEQVSKLPKLEPTKDFRVCKLGANNLIGYLDFFKKLAMYNEVSGTGDFKMVYLEIVLDERYTKITTKKSYMYKCGQITIKDLTQCTTMGTKILVSPRFDDPNTLIVKYQPS